MRIITNYWPDPRFVNAGKLALNGCVIANHQRRVQPILVKFPRHQSESHARRRQLGDARTETGCGYDHHRRMPVERARIGRQHVSECVGPFHTACQLPTGRRYKQGIHRPSFGDHQSLPARTERKRKRQECHERVHRHEADYTALQGLVAGGFLAGDLMPRA